jgi:hypothetical protein
LKHFITIKNLWVKSSDSTSTVTLTCAQEFLCKLYTDIKTLKQYMNIQEVRRIIDSVTRHELENFYTDDRDRSNFFSLEESLWTHSTEFLDIALKLSNEFKQEIKKVEIKIVQEELQQRIQKLMQNVTSPPIDTEQPNDTEPPIDTEPPSDTKRPFDTEPLIEDTAVNLASKRRELQKLESVLKELKEKGNAALKNPTCQKIIKLKSEKIVTQVRHNVETENREFIKQQHTERDAQLKTSHAGGGDGGEDGGGFGYEDVTSSSEEEGNQNNGGHFRNRDASGREYGLHNRLNKEAEKAAADKETPFEDQFAPQQHSSDEDNSEDEDWKKEKQVGKQRGRNKHGKGPKDADGFVEYQDMTNIYIVKLPHAPKAFISGRRVPALALGLEAEDEVRLASDDELDGHGAGSSGAKYAV